MLLLNQKSKIKNQKCRRCRAGFTVLEMIVATVSALIIFLVGFTLISGTSEERAQSMTRVRMTENARLLFQLLERDLSGAYDVVYPPLATTPFTFMSNTVIILNSPNNGNYVLQFCTKVDTPNMTNQYVLVQYFVYPTANVLCRQVTTVNSIPTTATPPDTTVSTYALFDMVYGPAAAINVPNPQYRFQITGQQWQPVTKTFSLSPSTPYTHLQVTLVLQYNQNANTTPTTVTFSKYIAIPAGFQ